MSGLTLTDTEVMALALRLFARHLMYDDWLEWGDVPELTESTFEALTFAVAGLVDGGAKALIEKADELDAAMAMDSVALLERAS